MERDKEVQIKKKKIKRKKIKRTIERERQI